MLEEFSLDVKEKFYKLQTIRKIGIERVEYSFLKKIFIMVPLLSFWAMVMKHPSFQSSIGSWFSGRVDGLG